MVFADNLLRLEHAAGFGIEFNALDALKRVDALMETVSLNKSVIQITNKPCLSPGIRYCNF
jgi:hypothetical protein